MTTAQEAIRTLAEEWTHNLDSIARRMFEELVAEIPLLAGDEELRALTLASCLSNVEALLTMLRLGIPADAGQAPVGGIEHARAMSRRGHEVDATLHFYRVGVAFMLREWGAELGTRVDDKTELVTALQDSTSFCLEYIDIVSSKVSAAHLAERERRQRQATLLRADLVRRVLAGEPVDAVAAERTLAHPLSGAQLAFTCWTERDPAALDAALGALARPATRPLTIADGPRAVHGWIVPRDRGPAAWRRIEEELATAAPDVLVAVGEPGDGVEGFRESHRQATAAREVARLTRATAPVFVRYRDCALVSLLTRDLDDARAFATRELGGLAARDSATADLRRTLLEVVRPRGGPAVAARVLNIHRNTVMQRIRRAETLRGSALDVRAAELYAALLLDAALAPA